VELNLFIAQLAVVFLPGLIWARIDVRYASKVKPTEIEFALKAFTYGVATYAFVFLFYKSQGWHFDLTDLSDADKKSVIGKNVVDEIIYAIAFGFALSVIWIYANNYKIFTRFLQFIKATKRFGDEDVWDFTFNSDSPSVEYVHLRDFNKKVTYAGYVKAFSETGRLRELVLRDVIVYDFDGAEMFKVPLIYLARPPEDIHIEFPY